MRQQTIDRLIRLNDEHVSRYLGTQYIQNTIVPRSAKIPHLDQNNQLHYPSEYFDLMATTILLTSLPHVQCRTSANLASLTMRLAKDGLLQGGILQEHQAEKLTNALMYNKLPDSNHIYQYLNFILRYDYKVLPEWFYHTLLMWAYVTVPAVPNNDTINKLYVWMIHNYGLCKFTSHLDDRQHDTLRVQEKLSRTIKLWLVQTKELNETTAIYYIIDMLHTTALITLAAMIARSCKWATLTEVGSEALGYQLSKYQTRVNEKYIHSVK